MASDPVPHLEILIVRHGESEGNRDRVFGGHGPMPLTERGRRQAEAAASAIAQRPLDAIYVSDLPRALQTAEPLARLSGQALRVTEKLRERSVGALTGLTFEEVQARMPDEWEALFRRDLDHCPPGGESHRDCARRAGAFLDELLAAHPTGRVAVVSHGVTIHHLVCHVLGAGESLARFIVHVDNCSIHRLQRRADGIYRVLALNDVAHLAGID